MLPFYIKLNNKRVYKQSFPEKIVYLTNAVNEQNSKMSRKTLIKTVSIPLELQNFLDEHPDLSLSKICQSKIIEIRENRRLKFAEIDRLTRQNKILQNKLYEANDMIEELEKKLQGGLKNYLKADKNVLEKKD